MQTSIKTLNEVEVVFKDIESIFEKESDVNYLKALISLSDLEKLLTTLELAFIENEDYLKCAKINKWKLKLFPYKEYNL